MVKNKSLFLIIILLLFLFIISPLIIFNSGPSGVSYECSQKIDSLYSKDEVKVDIYKCSPSAEREYSKLGFINKSDMNATFQAEVGLYLNNAETLSVNPNKVLLHELGHIKGLHHQENNVMSKYMIGHTEEHDTQQWGYINNTTWNIAKNYELYTTINLNNIEDVEKYLKNQNYKRDIKKELSEEQDGRYIYMHGIHNTTSGFYSD